MTVITRQHGKIRKAFLDCLSHYKRGPHVCPNGRLMPMQKADHAVLGALEADTLNPRIVSTIIDMVFAQLAPANAESTIVALKRDLHVLDGNTLFSKPKGEGHTTGTAAEPWQHCKR